MVSRKNTYEWVYDYERLNGHGQYKTDKEAIKDILNKHGAIAIYRYIKTRREYKLIWGLPIPLV
jgi:S-adenosylmethionine:tRNA-ribosyltransferase-isomerase (queuine synthetase)